MTNCSDNFSFLDNRSPDLDRLHCFALQAEGYLHSDPNTSMMKIRQFGELMAQEIAARHGEFREVGEHQESLLRRLSSQGIFRSTVGNLFHEVRTIGNKAVHNGLSDYSAALKVLKCAYELACWFYLTYIEEDRNHSLPKFSVPINRSIELDKIVDELSESKTQAELNQNIAINLENRITELKNLLSEKEAAERGEIQKQIEEINQLQNLLNLEKNQKDVVIQKLEELQEISAKATRSEKEKTIIKSNQQEAKIQSVSEIDALKVGTLLRNRYEIVEHMSAGSFGVTYVAKDLDFPDAQSCVIKQFNPPANLSSDDRITAREGFDREAKTLADLDHDYIPKLRAQFDEDEQSYIVQSLVDGTPITQELSNGNKYDEQYICKLLVDILTPLAYVHSKNIVHRDLKPDNLIRRKDGKISLIDFGAVKIVANQLRSQVGTTIGTFGYMPSEQSNGYPKFSSDIYAVGIIAIQAATGIKPSEFPRDPSTENIILEGFAPQLSQGLKDILSRMTKYNFSERYTNAGEALKSLSNLSSNSLIDSVNPKTSKQKPPSLPLSQTQKKENTNMTSSSKLVDHKKVIISVVGLLALGVTLSLAMKTWGYFTKPKIASASITIGVLTSPSDYQELSNYLRQELVPANYFDYILGKKIGVIIEGDKSLPYQESKRRLADKKWDILFARSPMISRFAQKQNYSYLAGMFPNSPSYSSGIFVKADSPIKSIDDITPSTVVALGDFDSASSFYMPVYDLYGKTFSVNISRNNAAMSLLAEGKADVAASAINDKNKNSLDFRIIHTSRAIPGSGVYLSPELAPEYQQIKEVLLAAPEEARAAKKANYGNVPEANYAEFDKIIDRVDSIKECVDFKNNPVKLFCEDTLAKQ